MSFTYTICETRESSVSVTGKVSNLGVRTVNHKADRTYRVLASAASPAHVTDIEIACIAELPVVNKTTWYSATAGVGMPFAVCRSKEVARSRDNAYLFDVKCSFETGDIEAEQCAAAPPAALNSITPIVTATVNSYERVLYADKDGKQCWQLPTDTPFQQPITETIPTLTLNITQFESAITYEQMMERSFKTNKNQYRSKDAGLWMIGAVKATEQTVQLAGGPTNAVKVTYPIMLSERYFYPPGLQPTETNRVIYGHDKVQPLVDTMRIDVDGNLVPIERNGSVRSGYIDVNGQLRDTPNELDKRPDYLRFRSQDEIDFSLFLQA